VKIAGKVINVITSFSGKALIKKAGNPTSTPHQSEPEKIQKAETYSQHQNKM